MQNQQFEVDSYDFQKLEKKFLKIFSQPNLKGPLKQSVNEIIAFKNLQSKRQDIQKGLNHPKREALDSNLNPSKFVRKSNRLGSKILSSKVKYQAPFDKNITHSMSKDISQEKCLKFKYIKVQPNSNLDSYFQKESEFQKSIKIQNSKSKKLFEKFDTTFRLNPQRRNISEISQNSSQSQNDQFPQLSLQSKMFSKNNSEQFTAFTSNFSKISDSEMNFDCHKNNSCFHLKKGKMYSSLINLLQKKLCKQNKNNICFTINFIGDEHQLDSINQQKTNKLKILAAKSRIALQQLSQQFLKLIDFLSESSSWAGLFRQQKQIYSSQTSILFEQSECESQEYEYYGLCFENGSYTEVMLSKSEIKQHEYGLVSIQKHQQNILSSEDYHQIYEVDITLLLLYRLISTTFKDKSKEHIIFPFILNRLFGYQYKTFGIANRQSTIQSKDMFQMFEYIDKLRQIHQKQIQQMDRNAVDPTLFEKSRQNFLNLASQNQSIQCNFQIYGFNKIKMHHEKINPNILIGASSSLLNISSRELSVYEFRELFSCKNSQKYLKKFTDIYNSISIINMTELPVKSINSEHVINYFTVINVKVAEEGLHFISIAPQQRSQSSYRICMISSQNKMILECLILKQYQSFPLYLPVQQFQIYISKIENPSKNKLLIQDEKICSFSFSIQASRLIASNLKNKSTFLQKSSVKELQLKLKLKQENKCYTSMILEQFMKFSYLQEQIYKFWKQIQGQKDYSAIADFSDQDQFSLQEEISYLMILRINIKSLSLYIDCFQVPRKSRQQYKTLKIQYSQPHTLCDNYYDQNTILLSLSNSKSSSTLVSNPLIYLTKNSSIKKITLQKGITKRSRKDHNLSQKINYKLYEMEW